MKENHHAWFAGALPIKRAAMRLFCFPYAGGSASAYHQFQAGLGSLVEVCPIELPGRASRIREPAYRDLATLVEQIFTVLEPHLGRPYALFGYSMGSLIAFELARKASALGREPSHLFVAARTAPGLSTATERLSELPDDALLLEVARRYRAIPDILMSDPEMRNIIANLMRGDLCLVESYTYRTSSPLSCPITVFGGDRDRGVRPSDLQAWQRHTTGSFATKIFAGDHFFLEAQRAPLLRAIWQELLADSPHRAEVLGA